ncbi:metabotropic glutamate receptor 1-like, partial [Hetaerina americana]|uniref:metabotropic glutamate receptor 1-like n=1 Tax=Hetaerina americana TaxID=62018 RepID=UPI003A7F1BCD
MLENYGQSGMQAFRELAEQAGVICVAREASILSHAEDSAFDGVLRNLAEDPAANVVVCFCEGFTVRGLLAASKRLKLTNRFLFVGSDGWADRSDVVEGLESEAVGSLSIRIHSPYVKRFDDAYFRLNPFTNDRNPWFREFWEERFNCTMPPVGPWAERAKRFAPTVDWTETNATSEALDDSSSLFSEDLSSPLVGNATPANASPAGGGSPPTAPRKTACTGQERLSDKYRQDPKLSFVIKAIYALAHGLHGLQQDVCGRGSRGLCPQLFPFNGSLFKNYLMNVTFEYWEGDLSESVEFDRRGDPPGRYNIMNFQQLPNGSYDYIHVGDWINGSLNLWDSVKFEPRLPPVVNSVCSKPCQPGYFKNFQSGGQEQRCCWVCVPCDKHEILFDEITCEACPPGYWPDANKTRCEQIPVERVRWSDPAAAVALSFSAAGFISAAFSAAVFLRHNNTPVVKASTRELSYLIAGGAVIGHAAAIPLLATPSPLSCALARTLPGLSLAVIYAALLTKTNRIARIMAAASATYVSGSGSGGKHIRFPTRKPRLMSAAAQVAITSALIGVEAGVAGAMLALEPPDAALFFPAPGRARLACNTSALGVVVPLTFGFTLLALCTAYAVKTRNVPENFREAKFIGFATYTTAVIWVAFVPIYFGSDSKVITMCLCVTLSASVTMGFIFVPKLYVILWRPERNDRAYFTTATSIRCHVGGSRPAQK